jgi:hypothetical protein
MSEYDDFHGFLLRMWQTKKASKRNVATVGKQGKKKWCCVDAKFLCTEKIW